MSSKVVFDRAEASKSLTETCVAVARMMIEEIICTCGHKNKARDIWISGLFKDECENCGNELPIAEIYGSHNLQAIEIAVESDDDNDVHAAETLILEGDSVDDEVMKALNPGAKKDHIEELTQIYRDMFSKNREDVFWMNIDKKRK